MSKQPENKSEIISYKTDDGRTWLEIQLVNESVWLSLNQMTELFQRDKSVISKHVKNVFEEGELSRIQLLQILQQLPPMARPTS